MLEIGKIKLTGRKVIYLVFAVLFLLMTISFLRVLKQQGVFLTLPQGTRILLEIADSPEERLLGLLLLETLPEDRGMLFIFEEREPVRIWTRHYSFAVDLLWLDQEFRILQYLEQVAQP